MAEVKRWAVREGWNGVYSTGRGGFVESSDHDSEVSRLHREKAKLFVRCLELMADAHDRGGMWKWKKTARLYRLARYITAKYLGSES